MLLIPTSSPHPTTLTHHHQMDYHHFLFIMVLLPCTAAQPIRGSTDYPYTIHGNVSPLVKIILAALIFGMFLIAFFSLYLRRCLHDSTVTETRPPLAIANHRLRLRFPCGLDRSVVESFPVFLYSDVKHLKIGNRALECAVCISEFGNDERLRFLPKCHHVFHPDCIDAWLASHITCPVCRADLTKAKLDGNWELNNELTRSQIDESTTEPGPGPGPEDHNIIDVEEEEERATPKIPRSHSTGHSLVLPGENCERYTLRLPDEVEKQMVTLKRAKSCGCRVDVPADGSSRRGGRRWNPDRLCGGSDLWNCTVTRMPAFIAKSDSVGKNEPPRLSSSSATLPV